MNSQTILERGVRPVHIPSSRSRRAIIRYALAGTASMLAACTPGGGLPPLPEEPDPAYHLGAGDQIRVIVFGQDQITGQFRVNDAGSIAIPLIGLVHAAGLTTAQLQDAIAADLKRADIVRAPNVSVEVLSYRPVFILGEVKLPGQYPFQPGMTVLTAVAVAGGFTYRAVTGYATILRNESGRSVEGRVTRGTAVQPGDVITILERHL
jgi:polysaccharide biosynthesis/export protein